MLIWNEDPSEHGLWFQALAGEISPFLCSGSHQVQRDCQPSALNCFVEAMAQCVPPVPIRPCVLKYLGKTHNLWLRSTLMLEHQAFEKGLSLQIKPKQTTEFYEQESITPPQQVSSGRVLPAPSLPATPRLHRRDIPLVGGSSSRHSEVVLLGGVPVMSPQKPCPVFQEILDSLAELYSLLQEEDMWAGLWQKRCKYSETATAIAYEQHGFFEQVAL